MYFAWRVVEKQKKNFKSGTSTAISRHKMRNPQQEVSVLCKADDAERLYQHVSFIGLKLVTMNNGEEKGSKAAVMKQIFAVLYL